jgi:hypothetical protein
MQLRRLAAEHGLYVETFLGAAYHVAGRRVVVIAPHEDLDLPAQDFDRLDDLRASLPANCLFADEADLTRRQQKGTPQTFGEVMALWERLHAPFLAAADSETDPVRQIEGYRLTTRVDYASELAHQKLSHVSHELARQSRQSRRV